MLKNYKEYQKRFKNVKKNFRNVKKGKMLKNIKKC